MDETETIRGQIIGGTDKAVRIETDSGDYWVPRSLIEGGDDLNEFNDSPQDFEIALWFVDKEGVW